MINSMNLLDIFSKNSVIFRKISKMETEKKFFFTFSRKWDI